MPDLNKKEVFKALSDDATYGTTAHVISLATFGEKVYEMDPLELFMALQDEYKMEISDEVCEKLQAILLATTTDAFFEDPVAFRAISNTLIEGDPGFDGFDNLTVPEILWAIYEVELNHEEMEFSPAVSKLIEKELEEEVEDIDEVEEAIQVPYYHRAIRALRSELAEQLEAVGFANHELPSVDRLQ
tara:strand:- start:77 stop:637 length:561 start_codon:yes stop_codon:yes gene_type:complete